MKYGCIHREAMKKPAKKLKAKEQLKNPKKSSKKGKASCFNRRFAWVEIAFPLTAIHCNPWNADTLLFCKADMFLSPFSTSSVQDLLDSADARLSLMQGCPHHWSIQQLDIIIALESIVVASR